MIERYSDAIGEDDPFLVMSDTPQKLRRLMRGLTEKQLSRPPAPGKWSIKQIVAHLADGEVILGSRYRLIAAHDRPTLQGYDQDLFVQMLGIENATTEELLYDFELARAVNIGLLVRLPEEAFDRVGIHSERGEESIETIVTYYAGHDRIHLSQVETIRTGLFPKKKAAKKKAAKKPAPQKAGAKSVKAPKATLAPKPKGKAAAKPAPKAAPKTSSKVTSKKNSKKK